MIRRVIQIDEENATAAAHARQHAMKAQLP